MVNHLNKLKSFLSKVETLTEIAPIEAILNADFPSFSFDAVVKIVMGRKMPTPALLEMLPKIYRVYSILYPSITSRSVKISGVRKIIKENQDAEAYTKSKNAGIFNISQAERNEIKTDYIKQIAKLNNDRISDFSKRDILNVIKQLTDKGVKITPYESGILLMLVSGMRPHELFTNVVQPAEDPNFITVSNIAKKRDQPGFTLKRPVILMGSADFITRLNKFRDHFKDMTTITDTGILSADKSKQLNKVAVKYFPALAEYHQSSSMLRKFYAAVSYDIYADKHKQNFNTYIKQVLGHSDINTSFSYSYISIKKPRKMPILKPILGNAPEAPEPRPPPVFIKAHRTSTTDEKRALLDKIYEYKPTISNAEMRKLSGIGSRLVNAYIAERR